MITISDFNDFTIVKWINDEHITIIRQHQVPIRLQFHHAIAYDVRERRQTTINRVNLHTHYDHPEKRDTAVGAIYMPLHAILVIQETPL